MKRGITIAKSNRVYLRTSIILISSLLIISQLSSASFLTTISSESRMKGIFNPHQTAEIEYWP
jgi:hypothetical protein